MEKFLQYNRVDEEVRNRAREIDNAINALVAQIAPTRRSERRRKKVYEFIRHLIQDSLDSSSIATGSYSQKTYLPESDIDITITEAIAHSDSWCLQLNLALCTKALQQNASSSDNTVSTGM